MEVWGIYCCLLSFKIIYIINAFQFNIPSNFYGSSEVYSGYLANSEVFMEAFTLHDDHVSISGSTAEVTNALEKFDTTGK